MAVYFLETSALVKRYAQETGTAWVQVLADMSQGNILYVAQVSGVEAVAALTLRSRRGSMTLGEASAAIADLRRDLVIDYVPVQITDVLLRQAMGLIEKHGLRGYDSVQLSSALQISAERTASGLDAPVMVCADSALNAATMAEGLTVDNPNAHP
ncbi:MAG: type II toxin-antitoxin system VapC family toxin [Janthinobacterium lividum]